MCNTLVRWIDWRLHQLRKWSLLISGTGAEGICPRYQNLWLYFTSLWKLLLAFYRDTKTFCHKSLKVWGTKTCTCDKQLLTKKQNHRQDQELLQCIYFIHIYYELLTILFIYCKHTLTHTHLESIYTIWNYLIKGIPNIISRNKGELSKLYNQK